MLNLRWKYKRLFRDLGQRSALVILILYSISLQSQDIWELGGKFGITNYQGDLVREHLNVLESNFSWSLLAIYNYDKGWSVKGEAGFMKITADDLNYSRTEDPSRYERALKMENNMMVISAMIEYYPFWRYCPYFRPRFASVTRFHPYFGTGVGLIFSDLEFEDQNLSNGKQEAVEDPIALSIPFEFGLKYFIHPDMNLGISVTMTRSFSDRLDGYEFKEDEDWYTWAGFIVTVRIY